MKIGIVTQPLEANYGGIIQNYALQYTLRKLGHDPITLRTGKFVLWRYLETCLKITVNKIIHFDILKWRNEFPFYSPKLRKQKVGLESFIQNNISVTPKMYWYDSKLINKYSLQALCAGSDKIWAPYFRGRIKDVFFEFASDYDIIRFSYAPSFGTDQWSFNSEITGNLCNLASRFSGLSVREESGVRLCKNYLNRNAFWAIDPTLLLTVKEYNDLCRDIPQTHSQFLFAYILDLTDKKMSFINSVAAKFKLEVIVKRAERNIKPDDTMNSWLACFRDAQFVITDSFHGTAFSINYNKDFYSIVNTSRGIDRFASLISLMGNNERFVDENIENSDIASSPIEWELVNKRVEQWRKESLDFLNSCFSCDK